MGLALATGCGGGLAGSSGSRRHPSLTRYALPASTQLTSFPAEPVSQGTGPTAEASSILLLLWVSQGDRHVWGQSRSPRFLFWRPGGESPQTSECPRGAGGQQTLLTW